MKVLRMQHGPSLLRNPSHLVLKRLFSLYAAVVSMPIAPLVLSLSAGTI